MGTVSEPVCVCVCLSENSCPLPHAPPTPNPNQDLADGWKEAECLFSIKGSPDTIFRLVITASRHICLKLTIKWILVMTQNALSLCPHARPTGPASPRSWKRPQLTMSAPLLMIFQQYCSSKCAKRGVVFCCGEKGFENHSKQSESSVSTVAAGANVTRRARVHSTSQRVTVLALSSVNQNRSEQEMEGLEHQKRNLDSTFFFFFWQEI